MSIEQHPALSEDYDDVPSLTLVLPGGLSKDQILAGVVQAVGHARTEIAARAIQFRLLAEGDAFTGDAVSQALFRGQALGGENATAMIDEAIVEVFVLWDQYESQCLSETGQSTEPHALPESAATPRDFRTDGPRARCSRSRRPPRSPGCTGHGWRAGR
jgi:hypothetical protein